MKLIGPRPETQARRLAREARELVQLEEQRKYIQKRSQHQRDKRFKKKNVIVSIHQTSLDQIILEDALLPPHQQRIQLQNQDNKLKRHIHIHPDTTLTIPPSSRLILIAPVTLSPTTIIHLQPNSVLYIENSSLEGESILIATKALRSQTISDVTIHMQTSNIQILGANTVKHLTIGSDVTITGKNHILGSTAVRKTPEQRKHIRLQSATILGEQHLKDIDLIPYPPPHIKLTAITNG